MVSGSPLQSKRRQWRRRRMVGLRLSLSLRVRLRQRRPKQKVCQGEGTRGSGVVF